MKKLFNDMLRIFLCFVNINHIDDTLLDTSSFAETARKAAIEMMVENGLPLEKDEAYELLKEIIAQKGSNYDKHFNVLTKTVLGEEDPFLIALGMTTKEIAEKRFSSFHTVNTHRKNIFRKLGVNNVHEATKYALRAGLVDSAEYYI